METSDIKSTFVKDTLTEMQKQVNGEFTYGKLNKDDLGALTLAVGEENGNVKIIFPYPVDWIAFPPDQAADLAILILKHAKAIGLIKPIVMDL